MTRMLKLVALGALVCAPMAAQGQELLTNGNLNSETQLGSPSIYYSEPTGWITTTDPCSNFPCVVIPYVFGQNYTPYSGHPANFAERITPGDTTFNPVTMMDEINPGLNGYIVETYQGRYPGEIIGPVNAEIKQIVPGVAGNIYRFSGWAHFEAGYAGGVATIDANSGSARAGLPSETDTIFALEFLDSMGSVLPNSIVWELHNDGGQQNDFRIPDGRDWVQHTLRATAPAGTVSVQVRAGVINGEFNIDPPGESQNVFFDDFSLQVVPEPASVLLLVAGIGALAFVRRRK